MCQTSRRLVVLLAVLWAAVLAGACRAASTPEAPPITEDTWAVVDGRQITRAEVDKAFDRNRDPNQPLSEEETLIAKLGLLDDLIMQDLLAARAPALQVTVEDAEVDKALTDAKAGAADDVFQKELARRGLTEGDVRESLRRELTVQKVLQREISDKVVVSDQEVTDFFNANKAQFNLPEDALRLAQIVVTPGPDQQIANRSGDDAATPQAAQTKVETLMQRLQGGAPFGDLARDFSEDPDTAPRGGDLGLVPLSALRQAPPALRNAVIGMEPGRARVVNDGNVLRIVLVVSEEKAGQRDLTTPGTREQITQGLRARKEQLLRDAYLNARRTDADITNYLARRLVERNGTLQPAETPSPAP
jgi:peptidyl-prolyl cis-trans isomerase SurA